MNCSATRSGLCLLVGALTSALIAAIHPRGPHITDINIILDGARLLWHGLDPYALIGPGRPYSYNFPFLYPLTAPVVTLPFAWMPNHAAHIALAGLFAAALCWALTRDRINEPRLWVFSSLAFLLAANMTQWSVPLSAAALVPSLGFLLAVKPSIGAALWIAYPSRRAFLLGAVLALAAVALRPRWPIEWLATIRLEHHMVAPITRPFGWLVLLALLRWRRPEARLLVALACVPQTAVLYEAVPLFLVVRKGWEGATLSALTYIVFVCAPQPPMPLNGYASFVATWASWMTWLLYLPCAAAILARPNESPVGSPEIVTPSDGPEVALREWRTDLP